MTIEHAFWTILAILVYTYIGYGVVIYLMARWKRRTSIDSAKSAQHTISASQVHAPEQELPEVTLLIAAYNERDIIEEKLDNLDSLTYPSSRLNVVWVTDGSSDGTPELLQRLSSHVVHHRDERKGKTAAINRVMPLIETPVVVFTDANTLLHPEALQRLVAPYANPAVGAVSGEKRVGLRDVDLAHGAGEGLYWKYESKLKELDSEVHTVVGAAGELFSIRTELFEEMEEDTILDDFMMTLRIVEHGYRVAYVKDAWALEAPSASLADEMKRKTRICAGGFQSMMRLPGMLNAVKRPVATFQYVSHRLLRWLVTPFLLPVLLLLNVQLATVSPIYLVLLSLHLAFYAAAFAGWVLRNRNLPAGWMVAPLYFSMMNIAAWIGLWRFLSGNQSAVWIRARRAV